jgi:hypothetical protein
MPDSSNSSSRISTASDSSTASCLGVPMSPGDAKIIFGNISEPAILADTVTQQLEKALCAVVEGGQGQDAVGFLFLDTVHDLEKPYKQYITRHRACIVLPRNTLPVYPKLRSNCLSQLYTIICHFSLSRMGSLFTPHKTRSMSSQNAHSC